MATYTIQIHESQRALIEAALCATNPAPGSEAESLFKMFNELPVNELEMQTKYGHRSGTTTHGFTV